MSKILIIDDEKELITLLQDEFKARGHQVLAVYNGTDDVSLAKKQPELIVPDIMVPEMDRSEVCRKTRDELLCPILLLSTEQAENDKIRALTLGGGDYTSKPFGLREPLTRIDANPRREQQSQYINAERKRTKLHFNELNIGLLEHSVRISGEAIPLSERGYDIIELLTLRAGQVSSREHIYGRVWEYDLEGDSYIIVEYIRKIRRKFFEVSPDTEYISTIWGTGYKWNRT